MTTRTLGRAFLFAAVFSCVTGILCAQERPVPSDSARVAIPGCAKGRAFIVSKSPEHEPTSQIVSAGSPRSDRVRVGTSGNRSGILAR